MQHEVVFPITKFGSFLSTAWDIFYHNIRQILQGQLELGQVLQIYVKLDKTVTKWKSYSKTRHNKRSFVMNLHECIIFIAPSSLKLPWFNALSPSNHLFIVLTEKSEEQKITYQNSHFDKKFAFSRGFSALLGSRSVSILIYLIFLVRILIKLIATP